MDEMGTVTESRGVEAPPAPVLSGLPMEEKLPTLAEAFGCVRAALEGIFADNLPALAECELIQALHNDGNVGTAWRRAVLLLEMAVNAPLRQ
jgi:hypothetical protein